ncbi:type II RES/Xre toxin-antitoxin system antitoxin [Pedobacter sp.]|uniref:type II RES/Xre toxin-antitoxin system antitoxin n=1 Tax=Pedobacter sp. TaxID=1411316 RepID=UPI003D7FD2EA
MATEPTHITNRLDKEISDIVKRASFKNTFISGSTKKQLTYTDFLSNKMLMIFVIREGVPYSLFNLIQHFTPFTEDNWADFLDVSTKSLHRYKKTSKSFKSIQSEKIIEMFEVTKVGLDVFGEMEKFKLWLEIPNFSLGNLKPIELLKDSYGKELVLNELTRINYGILV